MAYKLNTQLTSAEGYNINRMIFSKPISASVPNTPISYQRINISTKNPDGTIGDLIVATEEVFSFGVSANRSPDTQQINGYVMPLCLWNKEGASKSEKNWTDVFNNIVEHTKEHLVSKREEIGLYDLEMSDLKRFNPLYWKKERNQIVPGTGPTLYCKLIMSKKDGTEKILSKFYDMESNENIDAMDLQGKYCYVRAAVKIESIFIGNKCSLQVKLWEAEVSVIQTGMKQLMGVPRSPKRTTISEAVKKTQESFKEFDDVDLEYEEEEVEKEKVSFSLENSEDEDYEEPSPASAKKSVTRKTVAQ